MTISLEELNFRKWVAKSLNRQVVLRLLGAVGCFLAACAVLWLTWWAIFGVVWFITASFALSSTAIGVISWIVWGLLFVAYATANWQHLEKLEFESPAKLRVARAAAILADSPFLALTGPQTVGSFVKVIAVILLVGPGMAWTSWKLLQQALAAWRGSPDHVAEILQTLATAGARVSLEELTRVDAPEKVAATFAAVRLFDGVIYRSSEPVGLVLADSLRDELLAMIPKEKQQLTAAKPPPGRVSSQKPPQAAGPAKPRPKPRT